MAEASRLEARLDLQAILGQVDASGDVDDIALVQQIRPERVQWTRNPPAVADELEVTFSSAFIPIGLGLHAIEGARVSVWLYEHMDIGACAAGDPGLFLGIADSIRRDPNERTITLSCRDMTAVCLDAKVTTRELRAVDIGSYDTLAGLVRHLLTFAGPFARTWRVVDVDPANAGSTYAAFKAANLPRRPVKGKPARSTQRRLSTLDTLADGEETSVWDIICQACVRLGVVPEIKLGRDGIPEVHLIFALDLQTGDALRPFKRGDRRARSLTIGETIGRTSEEIRFALDEDMPDQVVVSCLDHETKRFIAGRFPAQVKGRGRDKPKVLFQVAEGVASQDALNSMAAVAWASARQRELTLEVETWSPWSDGGSPRDPDLLDLGAGAACVVQTSEAYAHNARRELEALQLPPEVVEAFMRAEDRQPPHWLFQVAQAELAAEFGSNPDFSCRLKLQSFLGMQRDGRARGAIQDSRYDGSRRSA